MTLLNYEALRAQALGNGKDEAVTVNTRALIDKVLARYSGEWTTLRELLQNAADASAKNVVVRFETLPSRTIPAPQTSDPSDRLRHVMLHHTLKSTVVENDGEVFRATDWARLKKIAEGNPDETKIGAFGVGFYSVFADCEEPLVSSGQEALAFHWKGDALFTKRLQLPQEQATKTTFVLPLRSSTTPVPDLMSLAQFLNSSLTFVGLAGIEMWVDEWKVLKLNKKVAPGLEIRIPKELNRKTKDGLMHVDTVTKEAVQLDAVWLKVMEWKPKLATKDHAEDGSGNAPRSAQSTQTLRTFFSRLAPTSSTNAAIEKSAKEEREKQSKISEDLLGESRATLFVHVNRAALRTFTHQNFNSELERATKKPPPKTTSISLLSTSYEESAASSTVSTDEKDIRVFEAFVPTKGRGKIFIGFTTNQTTGLNVHISTPSVIPTVERESIDLNNRFIRSWNVELLRAAGIAARVSWGHELAEMSENASRHSTAAGRKEIRREDIDPLVASALHLHDAYGWSETTPAAEVGVIMEEAFWTSNQKTAITTLSTRGILPSSKVRIEPEEGLEFASGIPVVPRELATSRLIQKLVKYGIITDVMVSDIKQELENKALDLRQLRQFLGWLAQKVRIHELDKVASKSLLAVAVANDAEDENANLLILSDMETFINTSRIPPDMPVPSFTLPFKLTSKLAKEDLELLGFEDLQMVPWLRWVCENAGARGQLSLQQDIAKNADFASNVLRTVSKQWDGLSQSSKVTIVDLLSQRTVIPTKMGMKKPSNAYFPSVKLFNDLPVMSSAHFLKEKFLVALGVRKTIEIGVVFERLMASSSKSISPIPESAPRWSHVDLIKYLASVRSDIPSEDIVRLRNTKICPAETEALQPTLERYLVSELFEPEQSLRHLGLRTLNWPGVYRPESLEGRFLSFLGLKSAPSYMELIGIMSQASGAQNWTLRDRAMKYFIDHHQTKGYANFDHSKISTPYLPIHGNEKSFAVPSHIFVNEKAAVLGFDVLRRDLQIHALKFGVKQDPPIADCVKRVIERPPNSTRTAREMFSYLATRVGELNAQNTEMLSSARIVPVKRESPDPVSNKQNEKSQNYQLNPPRMCFLGTGEKYVEIFDFVDFGHEANNFLLACGSKHEPSTIELARRLISEPAGILLVLGDERYLELLRNVAGAWRTLRKDKNLVRDLKGANCLLAYKEMSSKASPAEQDEEEESGIKLWELATADRIVIVDETITYNVFKEALLAAPMEESLEDFYHSLGAAEVSSLLEERHRLGPRSHDQASAAKLQHLLLERTRLFLNDYPADMIKHNFAWLQKHLSVECVQSISVRWTLKGYKHVRNNSRSAIISSDKPVLYITAQGYDILEVSQALVPVLLNRSKPQQIFMLEMLLESSLSKLRSRGYNVDRILRAKAAEARVAEETRKKQLAEEQQRIKEQELAWKERQAARMPGVFPDSPDRNGGPETQSSVEKESDLPIQKPRGLFSGISKHFNFDNVKRGSTLNPGNPPVQENGFAGGFPDDAPPPYTSESPQRQTTQTPQPEIVTAPHRLQRK